MVLVFCPEGSVSFETVAFSVYCIVSVVAISELPPDAETPTEVETVGDKELLYIFSSAVQAVNVPVAKINVSIIAIFFFILSPSFQASIIPKRKPKSRVLIQILTASILFVFKTPM